MSSVAIRLRADLDRLPPYRAGKRRDAIEAQHRLSRIAALASNEMPYGPLPSVSEALAAASEGLNRYPDPFALELRATLADRLGVTIEHVIASAGSIGVCQLAITIAAEPGSEVVFPWPSFEGYPLLAAVAGATPVPVPLDGDRVDLDRVVEAVTERTRVVFVCNPNNPTGTAIERTELDAMLRRLPHDRLVIVDEAYAEFADARHAALPLIADHPNLLVSRTFSKAYGLAGLRVGYGIGAPELVATLLRGQLPFTINSLAIVGARTALDHPDELAARVRAVHDQRQRVEQAARALELPVSASLGNFIWLRVGERTPDVAALLENHGVLSRPFAPHGVRVTVGDAGDTKLVIEALEAAAGAG